MKRWLPHPILMLILWLAWLCLQPMLTVANVLVGAALSVLLARLWARLDPPQVRMRHGSQLLRLGARVVVDIVRSNWAVARLILARRNVGSAFVDIDLDIHQPAALALLACIVTATPGTIWVRHDAHHRRLTIHVLDETTVPAMVHNIKHRYEPPLREVFR